MAVINVFVNAYDIVYPLGYCYIQNGSGSYYNIELYLMKKAQPEAYIYVVLTTIMYDVSASMGSKQRVTYFLAELPFTLES